MLEPRLFPDHIVIPVFAELNAWVSVEDVGYAARILEGRLSAGSTPQEFIIAPVPDIQLTEGFFEVCLRIFCSSFRCSGAKLLMAMYRDNQIRPETRQLLRDCRARLQIKFKTADEVRRMFPAMEKAPPGKYILVRDEPYIIELIYRPFLALLHRAETALKDAWGYAELKRKAIETSGGEPTIVHQPHADSPLPALIEAMAWHCAGLYVGVYSGPAQKIDHGFCHIALTGRPPFFPKLIEFARKAQEAQFTELRRD